MIEQPPAGDEYEFRVKDHLQIGWFRSFPGFSVENLPGGEVRIAGRVADPATLRRIFDRFQSLNLNLISLRRV